MSKTITGLSLIIGVLVIIIANLLIPGNSAGITGGDAISFSAMTEKARKEVPVPINEKIKKVAVKLLFSGLASATPTITAE